MIIKALNLSPGFSPTSYSQLSFELPILPGGELHPKLDKKVNYKKIDKVIITQRANCSNDIIAILVIADALRRVGVKFLDLVIPYIPYARQDRYDLEDNLGESFTLEIFANTINSVGFERVYVFDAHSDVAKGLIKNSCEIRNHEYVDLMLRDIFKDDLPFYLIAVDAGVSKKIDRLASYLWKVGWTKFNIVQCIKKRDMTTGQIYGFEVFTEDLQNIPCVLVDDICDGGASFNYAAHELDLYNPGDLYAFFSHGIFSSIPGYLKLQEYYKRIYTTNSIRNIKSDEFLTQFEFKI